MGSRRPLPLPPYPGVIPYQVDASEDEDVEPDENSPRLLGIEQRPVSSFGLPAQASLTQARDTFYQNWQKQQVGIVYTITSSTFKNMEKQVIFKWGFIIVFTKSNISMEMNEPQVYFLSDITILACIAMYCIILSCIHILVTLSIHDMQAAPDGRELQTCNILHFGAVRTLFSIRVYIIQYIGILVSVSVDSFTLSTQIFSHDTHFNFRIAKFGFLQMEDTQLIIKHHKSRLCQIIHSYHQQIKKLNGPVVLSSWAPPRPSL